MARDHWLAKLASATQFIDRFGPDLLVTPTLVMPAFDAKPADQRAMNSQSILKLDDGRLIRSAGRQTATNIHSLRAAEFASRSTSFDNPVSAQKH